MRSVLGLAAAAATVLGLRLAPAYAAEVPPELRGRISAEVTSCEAFPGGEGTRVVLVRVRAGTSGVRNPDVRCGAASASDHVLGWSRVRGLDEIPAGEAREAMVLVPADAAHDACRCVVAETREALCAPWQALENGRCVEPADVAAAPPAPPDELGGALRVSRALGPLHDAAGAGDACARVAPAQLRELVFALVPEDETVYVRSLWRRLDAGDQRAFARWARECFGATRLVDAERGVELAVPAGPQ